MHIYIGFETLKVRCTQYGICSQAAFKNARAMCFSKLGGVDSKFRTDSKKFSGGRKMFAGGLPPPGSDTPKSLWGGTLTSPVIIPSGPPWICQHTQSGWNNKLAVEEAERKDPLESMKLEGRAGEVHFRMGKEELKSVWIWCAGLFLGNGCAQFRFFKF